MRKPGYACGSIIAPQARLLVRLMLVMAPALTSACSKPSLPGKSAPAIPKRIISLSPSVTEILHGVGAFDRVVAVSSYCDYPPEVERLPRVGSWLDSNLERIVALRPDLVILTEAQAPLRDDGLRRLGLHLLVVRSQSIDDALSAVVAVGRAVGNDREGIQLAARTRATLDEVRAMTRGSPRPRVLCVVDRIPGTLRDLYAAAPGSFLFELIEIAGGAPVAPSGGASYGKLNKEEVVDLDPEIIIDMVQGASGKLAEDPTAVWRALPEVAAVRHGRIYPIRDTAVLHPSQFVADTARRFARLLHPELARRIADFGLRNSDLKLMDSFDYHSPKSEICNSRIAGWRLRIADLKLMKPSDYNNPQSEICNPRSR